MHSRLRQTLPVCFAAACLSFHFAFGAVPGTDSLSLAAEFYFSHHDYKQALALWKEVLQRDPSSEKAVARVSELKLVLEGRPAARDALLEFLAAQTVSAEARKTLREKLGVLQNAFLTDEGQSTFLQAVPKIRRGDCPGALILLNQAAVTEKGNVRVLREKARCEKSAGLTVRFFETLKQAYENNPFDSEVIDNLAEAQIYFREYPKVVALFRKDPDDLRSPRQRTAYGLALVETGEDVEALPLLQGVVESQKSATVPPMALYALGKIFAKRPDTQGEATSYLDRFLVSANRPEVLLVDGWDPYRSTERLEEARKLIASLRVREPLSQ